MATSHRNIIVVGGSYVGKGTAQKLAENLPPTHRVLLIEPHTHFHHIFTLPRFAVIPGYEQKAFIPYTNTFQSHPNTTSRHAIVQARVLSVQAKSVILDREWSGSTKIEFEYLVIATGSILKQPTGMDSDLKVPSVLYLRNHQEQIRVARSVLIVGGGAAGVQMATDLKQYYPNKQITLVHSREHLMPQFDSGLHNLIQKRFEELDIQLITGVRVVVPKGGFPLYCVSQEVKFTNGHALNTDFVVLTTGGQPSNALLRPLDRASSNSILNPDNGQVRVRPTLQFSHPDFDNFFAVGDIADTGAHKAARPGSVQAGVVATNIQALVEGRPPIETFAPTPAAIHLTLGFEYNVLFINPNKSEGQTQPKIIEKNNGKIDMNVESWWQRFGIHIENPNEFHL